jgi:hypothetical protein
MSREDSAVLAAMNFITNNFYLVTYIVKVDDLLGLDNGIQRQ